MYTDVIKPNFGESYQEYIDRLLKERNERKKNRPENIYTEGHHILPRCLGGSDNKENIVVLLPEEHYYCHKLLATENPENSGLQFAWWWMCHMVDADTQRQYLVSSEEYSEARRRVALCSAQMNSIPVVDIDTGIVYQSAEEAARQLKIVKSSNITCCCKKKAKSASGKRFCYLSDYISGNYEILTIGKRKRVINLDTNEIYESSVEAAQILNLSKIKIREVCRSIRKTTGRYNFAYYEDYLQGNYEIKPVGHIGKKVQEVETGIVYESVAKAGESLNLDPSSISKVCKGKLGSLHGHKFVFYSEN